MAGKSWPRVSLNWPPNQRQWEGLRQEIDAIYRAIRAIQEGTGIGVDDGDLDATKLVGIIPVESFPGLTGDVTAAAGTIATTLADSGVTPGTYGDSAHIPVVAVDEKGRVTSASEVAVDGLPPTTDVGDMLASDGANFDVVPVGTDGQVLTADSGDPMGVSWQDPAATVTAVAARAYRGTNQTLTHATEAAISFSATDFDTDSLWDALDPTKLTIPTGKDGKYNLVGQIELGSGFEGSAHLRLYVNGTIVAGNSYIGGGPNGAEKHQVSWIGDLAAGDEIVLKVDLELIAGSGTYDVVGGSSKTFLAIVSAGGAGGSGGGGDIKADGTVPFAADESMGGFALTDVADPTNAQDAATKAYVDARSGLVLLSETIISSATATLDVFTRNQNGLTGDAIQSDFDDYLLEIVTFRPVTNNVDFWIRMSTNGSSGDSSSLYALAGFGFGTGGSAFWGQNPASPTTALKTRGTGEMSNDANYSIGADIHFRIVSGAYVHVDTDLRYYNGSSLARIWSHGAYLSTTAVKGIQVLCDTGNITSAIGRLYGRKKP